MRESAWIELRHLRCIEKHQARVTRFSCRPSAETISKSARHASHLRLRSRGAFRPGFQDVIALLRSEGAGKAGRWPRPWPACRKKCRRQSPQVWPKRPAFPARWAYGLYALSPGTGSLAPVIRESVLTRTRPQHREVGTTRLHRPHERVRRHLIRMLRAHTATAPRL